MNKKKIDNNKGFTLVELIVVLVILAILAAILVPALLGYIDRARGQQIVLNARSAYTAAQAEMTSLYGKGKPASDIKADANAKQRMINTADVPGTIDAIGTKKPADENDKHADYTIVYVKYTEGDDTVYLVDGSWLSKKGDLNGGEPTMPSTGANVVGTTITF